MIEKRYPEMNDLDAELWVDEYRRALREIDDNVRQRDLLSELIEARWYL